MERGQTDAGGDGQTAGGSMTCGDVRELFPEYFKESLSPFQSVLFQEHCEICDVCRSELIRESQRKARDGWRMPAHRFSRSGHQWQRVGGVLFRPARVKLPLEAAALLLIVSLALYVTHRSSPPVSAVTINVAVPESPTINPAPTEAVQAEVPPEPKTIEKPKPASKVQGEAHVRFRPPTASVTTSRVVPEQTEPQSVETLSSAGTTPESDSRASSEQIAAAPAPRTSVEAATTNTQASGGTPAESPEKDRAPTVAGGDTAVMRLPRRPPQEGPYFFLYKPSMKPL